MRNHAQGAATLLCTLLLLSACNSGSAPTGDSGQAAGNPQASPEEPSPGPGEEPAHERRLCEQYNEPCYPDPAWFAREAANFAKVSEAPAAQAADPNFAVQWNAQGTQNRLEYSQRTIDDPNWSSGENACSSWSGPCTGDPFLYPGTDPFYDEIGEVIPVNFYDA